MLDSLGGIGLVWGSGTCFGEQCFARTPIAFVCWLGRELECNPAVNVVSKSAAPKHGSRVCCTGITSRKSTHADKDYQHGTRDVWKASDSWQAWLLLAIRSRMPSWASKSTHLCGRMSIRTAADDEISNERRR